ncbi:hypothetical protein TrST_g9679 [Triparma strigata]|uniref:WW domain-containing protein n=1 Tax=Triparma strigata TaxID=1606541 RepID=A0A9W7AC00_9STRA|nr:hypothetical protein TrST_g9679 [Triparma strigata]
MSSSGGSGDNAFTAFTSIDTTRKTFGSDGAARWQTWNKSDESKVGKASTNQPLHVAPRKKGDAMLGQLSGSLTWEEEKRISEQARAETGKSAGYVNFNTKKSSEKDRKSAPIMSVGPSEDNMKMKSSSPPPSEPPDGLEFIYADSYEGPKSGYVFEVRGDECGYFWDPLSSSVDDVNAVDAVTPQTLISVNDEKGSKEEEDSTDQQPAKKKRKKEKAILKPQTILGVPPPATKKKKKKKKPIDTSSIQIQSQAEIDLSKALANRVERLNTENSKKELAAEGWLKTTDQKTQKEYYFKPTTGETSWINPVRKLGEGWEEGKDGEGRVYYFRRSTGETCWEFPS